MTGRATGGRQAEAAGGATRKCAGGARVVFETWMIDDMVTITAPPPKEGRGRTEVGTSQAADLGTLPGVRLTNL